MVVLRDRRFWYIFLACFVVSFTIAAYYIFTWNGENSKFQEDILFSDIENNYSFRSDRRKDKSKLSIVEFNVEWLFYHSGKRRKIICPGKDCPWKNEKEAMEHIMTIASVLDQLDADIVHLNEVQDTDTLEILRNATKHRDEYRAYLVPGEDTITGQNVAILTKVDPFDPISRYNIERVSFPVPGSKCTKLESEDAEACQKATTGVSKHYRTRFKVPLYETPDSYLEWIMVGLHLLAFPGDPRKCLQREAQALAIQTSIKKDINSCFCPNVIIVGDLNDFDHRVDVPNPNKGKVISRALPFLYNSTDTPLLNVANKVDKQERYSCCKTPLVSRPCKDTSLIDHILVSQSIYDRIISVLYFHGYEIRQEYRPSDHWPIKITIDTR